jgi:ankyrin repeat protein
VAIINTVLNTEIAKGDFQAVKSLIENQGYSLNYTGFLGLAHTPLYTATASKQLEILDYLIQKGADVNASGRWWLDSTPLEIALESKHISMVASLLAANAQIPHSNYYSDSTNDYAKTKIVEEYLVKAAGVNDTASIEKILKNQYADINNYNFDDNYKKLPTALETAVKENHFEATALLIEQGAKIDSFSTYNWINHPLNLVEDPQITELLIKHTPDVNNALLMFTVLEKAELIPLLIKNGALINKAYFDMHYGFMTPLEAAIMKDDSAMIKCLVSNGADLAHESTSIHHSYATPLEYAGLYGKIQALETLIELGADLNHKNTLSGLTALELAFKAGHIDAANMLTLHGAHEIEPILTSEQITMPVVDEPYPLEDSSNATISDNIRSADDYLQPTNSTLLISIELNEVLCDEQMIMPVGQDSQFIQQDDNSTISDNSDAIVIYVQPVESVLGMVEHEQVFVG